MSSVSSAAGHAALAICESMLLSLTENKIIDETDPRGRGGRPSQLHTAGDRRRHHGPRGSRLADRDDSQGR